MCNILIVGGKWKILKKFGIDYSTQPFPMAQEDLK